MSVMHYADAGLSTELKRVLNQSTDISIYASVLNDSSVMNMRPSIYCETNASQIMSNSTRRGESDFQTQYMWLDRYHSHMEDKQNNNLLNSDGGRDYMED